MTRKYWFIIIAITGFAVSCKEEEPPHLPREKMVAVMTDIQLSEVYSTMVHDSLGRALSKNYDSLAWYYKSVLDHYHVSMDEFRTSLDWYTAHPRQFDTVYIEMQNELSKLEGTVNSRN